MANFDFDGAVADLQHAALEPVMWPEVLSRLSTMMDGRGAMLFMTDSRMPGPPSSPELAEVNATYFGKGWNERDERYRGVSLLPTQGVITDWDCLHAGEMDRSAFYQEFLRSHDCAWFGAVGFKSVDDLWCMSIQRTRRRGPFSPAEMESLKTLWGPLCDAATLSRQFGFAQVLGMAEGLQMIGRAAMVFDSAGRLLTLNKQAETSFAHLIDPRIRSLRFGDAASQAVFDALLRRAMLGLPEKILRNGSAKVKDAKGAISIRAITLREWARATFSGGRVLVLLREILSGAPPLAELRQTHGLSDGEARLASALCQGLSLAQAAEHLGIAYETARARLKTICGKTGTHRQSELVALLLSNRDQF